MATVDEVETGGPSRVGHRLSGALPGPPTVCGPIDFDAVVSRIRARLEGRCHPGVVGVEKEGGPVAGLSGTRTGVIPVRTTVRCPKNPVGAGTGCPPGADVDHAQRHRRQQRIWPTRCRRWGWVDVRRREGRRGRRHSPRLTSPLDGNPQTDGEHEYGCGRGDLQQPATPPPARPGDDSRLEAGRRWGAGAAVQIGLEPRVEIVWLTHS